MRLVSGTLAAMLVAAPAAAQEGTMDVAPMVLEEPTSAPTPDANKEGEYGGVAPGKQAAKAAEKPRKAPKKPKHPTVMWVGYQPLDAGSSRVFLQLSTNGGYEQAVVGSELVITLPGYRVDRRNDLRPLDTRFFDGAVARVAATPVKAPKAKKQKGKKQQAKGVEVRVAFKDGVTPRQGDARLEQAADGYFYLYLDFGPAPATAPAE